MTTATQTIKRLAHTRHPRERATLLYDLEHRLTENPAQARLVGLIGDTEALLDSPATAEPTHDEDPAWEDDTWWRLAGTANRIERADLLETIWRDWALGEFGDDADVLLQIAETERAIADDDLDTALADLQESLLTKLEERFDPEARLADVYERAGRTPPADSGQIRGEEAVQEGAPTTAVRESTSFLARVAGIGAAVLVAVVAFGCIAAPAAPLPLKFGCAVALAVGVLGWFGWMWRGLGR
ncbi:hypothetical protein ACFOY2_05550 [Nonomuraea purpurea]|uniref:Uncharacterized protein n=1 Tax=Nonomuraea purpurea TaxID=1849276 RepID=A0ABV8G0Z5_9ACTN